MSASRPVSALSALSSSSVEDMPRTRAKTAPKKTATTTTSTTTRKRTTTATTVKKPVSKTTKGSKAKPVTKRTSKPVSRPPWKDIIRECIVENKDDSRVGVSRATIKKFAEERYGVEMNPLNIFQLGRAIASGTETGIFVLPKGPSGKVKLAPKTGKPSAAKENSKPASKVPITKKPTVASKKTPTATKKVLAGKGGAKSPNKKPSPASKRNAAKKAATGAPAVRAAAKKTGRKPVARK